MNFKFNYFSEFDDKDEDEEVLYGTIQLQFNETWKPEANNSVRICFAYKHDDLDGVDGNFE